MVGVELAMVELIEVEPGKWRVKRLSQPPARSRLPLPYVISDTMEPTEQVDGKFYTSKQQFRAVGKALGLVEVGNDKARFHVKQQRTSDSRVETEKRARAVKTAIEKFKST
jgi:hypothetical protein